MAVQSDLVAMNAAREEFERLIPQLRNKDIEQQCTRQLARIVTNGGVVTQHDTDRLFGHISPENRTFHMLMSTIVAGLTDDGTANGRDGT